MSGELRRSTKVAIFRNAIEDEDYDLALDYFVDNERDRNALDHCIRRIIQRVVDDLDLMQGGTPAEVMEIYNAGVAEGFDAGYDTGYEQARQNFNGRTT